MLIVDNLSLCAHGKPMHFTFQLTPGDRLAIFGPSGAGKSTLLNLIAGFLEATAGRLCYNGRDLTGHLPAQRPISMLFQENNLFPHLNVAQNIGLGVHPGLKLNAQQRTQLQQIMQQMQLDGLEHRLPEQLSGGQRQRVALARCLLRRQPLLLLDEPFSALDPALRGEMLALVKQLCEHQGITLLMVTHHLSDAASIANRSLLVADGHVHWQGKTETLLNGEVPQAQGLRLNAI